jgi:hypothetical protein
MPPFAPGLPSGALAQLDTRLRRTRLGLAPPRHAERGTAFLTTRSSGGRQALVHQQRAHWALHAL